MSPSFSLPLGQFSRLSAVFTARNCVLETPSRAFVHVTAISFFLSFPVASSSHFNHTSHVKRMRIMRFALFPHEGDWRAFFCFVFFLLSFKRCSEIMLNVSHLDLRVCYCAELGNSKPSGGSGGTSEGDTCEQQQPPALSGLAQPH